MEQINIIIAGVAGYLLTAGLLVNWLGCRVSIVRQHQFAFVTILLLILGVVPQLSLIQVAPGIILSLGMMLFALHLSAYYSGTPQISAKIYAVILLLSAAVLAQLIHPIFQKAGLPRFLLLASVWFLLLRLENIVIHRHYLLTRVEQIFFWTWFLTACISLVTPGIIVIPDLFFLALLLTHLEKRWPKLSIPAPLVALYAILFVWHAHFVTFGYHEVTSTFSNVHILGFPRITTTVFLVIGFIFESIRTVSLTRKYFYLYLAHEVLLLGLQIENMYDPSQELIGLLRLLLFIALTGLFVMIESKDGQGLDNAFLRGLGHERPKFTIAVMTVILLLVLYPLVYIPGRDLIIQMMLGSLSLVGVIQALHLFNTIRQIPDRTYRILRPSLSIWSTVIFTLLWAAVTVMEVISRHYLG